MLPLQSPSAPHRSMSRGGGLQLIFPLAALADAPAPAFTSLSASSRSRTLGGMSDELRFALMAETGMREAIEKFFQAVNAADWDRIESFLDADYVWEMPQSGERARGIKNNREMNKNYPGVPKVETHRITG